MRARHREQILHYVIQAIRNEVEPENMLTAAAASAARALGAAGSRIFRLAAPGTYALAAEFGRTEGLATAEMEAILADINDTDITLEREIGPWRVLGAVTDYRAAINAASACARRGAWPNGATTSGCWSATSPTNWASPSSRSTTTNVSSGCRALTP